MIPEERNMKVGDVRVDPSSVRFVPDKSDNRCSKCMFNMPGSMNCRMMYMNWDDKKVILGTIGTCYDPLGYYKEVEVKEVQQLSLF